MHFTLDLSNIFAGFFFWEGGVDGGGCEIIVQMIISDETQQIPW